MDWLNISRTYLPHNKRKTTICRRKQHNSVLLIRTYSSISTALDRTFFKSPKGNYYDACAHMLRTNPKRILNRLQFGKLLGEA